MQYRFWFQSERGRLTRAKELLCWQWTYYPNRFQNCRWFDCLHTSSENGTTAVTYQCTTSETEVAAVGQESEPKQWVPTPCQTTNIIIVHWRHTEADIHSMSSWIKWVERETQFGLANFYWKIINSAPGHSLRVPTKWDWPNAHSIPDTIKPFMRCTIWQTTSRFLKGQTS